MEEVTASHRSILSSGGTYEVTHRFRRVGGDYLWFESRSHLTSDGRRIVAVSRDVTRRMESEERQRRLTRELDHRVKNTLAMVLALLRRTARARGRDDALFESCESRILAVARAHEVLSRRRGAPPTVKQAIDDLLAPFLDGELLVGFDGDAGDHSLEPRQLVPLSLILHELAANAAQHGAWASESGRVGVVCRTLPGGVEIEWKESGVALDGPPEATGTGLELIEGVARNDLRAELEMRFESDGLRARLRLVAAPE